MYLTVEYLEDVIKQYGEDCEVKSANADYGIPIVYGKAGELLERVKNGEKIRVQ